MSTRTHHAINLYAKNKKWYLYLPFLLVVSVFLYQVWQFKLGADTTPTLVTPLQILDFGIHELGHWLTVWAPQVICAFWGVGLEVLFPVMVVYAAIRYRHYFIGAMALAWVALAMNSGGQYMADARSQLIPLVSMDGSSTPIHDWHFVFDKLHLLSYDKFIGNTVRGIGFTLGIAGLLLGAYLIYKMAAVHDEATAQGETSQTEEAEKIESSRPAGEQLLDLHEKGKPAASLYPEALSGRLAKQPDDPESQNKRPA